MPVDSMQSSVADLERRVSEIEKVLTEMGKIGSRIPSQTEKVAETLRSFIQERCIVYFGRSTETAVLFNAFVQWCKKNGIEPCHETMFGRALRVVVPDVRVKQQAVEKNRIARRYWGVGLQPDRSNEIEEGDDE